MSFYDQFEKYDYPMFGYVRLPDVAVPAEDKTALGLKAGATNAEFLKALAQHGFDTKVAPEKKLLYGARLAKELEIVEKLGFIDYFLLVWKVCSDADKRGIARFGFMLPMDEARAQVAIDLSGRAYAVWEGKFSRGEVGGFTLWRRSATRSFHRWLSKIPTTDAVLTVAPLRAEEIRSSHRQCAWRASRPSGQGQRRRRDPCPRSRTGAGTHATRSPGPASCRCSSR